MCTHTKMKYSGKLNDKRLVSLPTAFSASKLPRKLP